jgi:hypothetical protein
MGVTYKLREEVVSYIIGQRQDNPLFSCRQLAESASQKFGLNLSKSSVHDVLKEFGIVTPRGRKPKDSFAIPHEKKQQIQASLSQIKLLPGPSTIEPKPVVSLPARQNDGEVSLIPDVTRRETAMEITDALETSPEYEGAGKIFLKAALWDLGIFSEENLKETDWMYYLTYAKGIKVNLENNQSFFIDLPLPLERCIRETVDGIINNIRPFIVNKVSDEAAFKACMEAEPGFKIANMSIVVQNDHYLLELSDIMEYRRKYLVYERLFVEIYEKNAIERLKKVFFSQNIDSNDVMNKILSLKGFDSSNKQKNNINLIITEDFKHKIILEEAIDRLNGMCLYDDQSRLVKVKIFTAPRG